MKTIAIPLYGGKLIVAANQAEFDRAYDRLLAQLGQTPAGETFMLSPAGLTTSAVVADKLVVLSGMFIKHGGARCHEAVHCAQAVAEAVGMNPLREQEAFAYLTQWFYEELAP